MRAHAGPSTGAVPPLFTGAALTPVAFLERAGLDLRDRVAVLDGSRRLTYGELLGRARTLTGVLARLGVRPGDRVAALCANSALMLELHNAVPMAGAVLVPLNIRLSVEELAWILRHSGASALFATQELTGAATALGVELGIPLVLEGEGPGQLEELLASKPDPALHDAAEGDVLAINYTSGTTGSPKGVTYLHRGAYLQALAMAHHAGIGPGTRYLWTLPMFHCNGWCFTWALTAVGATHVCLRAVDTEVIWEHLLGGGITHLAGAPTVMTMIAASAPPGAPRVSVSVQTGGSPPTPSLLERLSALGLEVTHLYGLTETYGPIAINVWQPEWDELPQDEQARLKARQGIGNIASRHLRVIDAHGRDVPEDAETQGEIVVSGNNVMSGYYLDPRATEEATIDGWLRTGDVAVVHPDRYVEIRDRSKDVIISGGENISSVEIERTLERHPDVLEAAVVARAHDTWGQVPVAYVTLRTGSSVTSQELRDHVREHLAGFKVPKQIFVQDLPKTSTGKIRKNVLRELAAQEQTP
jgi:fatty-acyl-CoA synthase